MKIAADGNSYVEGEGYTPFPSIIGSSLGITVPNFGVSGQTTEQMLVDQAAQILPLYDAGELYNILLIVEGGNDIFFNGSVEDAIERMIEYSANARDEGFKTIVSTTIPRNQSTTLGDNSVQYNAKLVAFNQALLDNAIHFDGIIRPDLESIFSSYGSGGYDVDEVHPNQTGQQKHADLFLAEISFLTRLLIIGRNVII